MLAATTDFVRHDLHTWHRATLASEIARRENADLFLARRSGVCSVMKRYLDDAVSCMRILSKETLRMSRTWRLCATSTVARFSMVFPRFYERLDTNAISEHAQLPASFSLPLHFPCPFIFFFILQFLPHVQRKFSSRILAQKRRQFSSGFSSAQDWNRCNFGRVQFSIPGKYILCRFFFRVFTILRSDVEITRTLIKIYQSLSKAIKSPSSTTISGNGSMKFEFHNRHWSKL